MITAAGVGSGIDIESILSSLNEVNSQPVDALNSKRSALDVELSAFGKVKGALSSFKTATEALGDTSLFGAFTSTSSDEEVFTVTSNGKTSETVVDIEVLSLATSHSIGSGPYDSSESLVGAGTYAFSSGTNQFEIDADTATSLEELRNAINSAIDNTSISASIINVDGGSRLILTANETGAANQIGVEKENTVLLGLGGYTEVSEAQDASLIVHGFAVTSASNTVSDAVEGITLELVGTGSAKASAERDTESLRESLTEFVSSYNSMSSTLSSLSTSDLQGDSLPRSIESRMRATFFQDIELSNGESKNVLALGLSFDRYGTLSVDETEFEEALSDMGVDAYTEAFTSSDTGISDRFSDLINEYTQSGGIIDAREDGVETRQSTIDDQIDRLEYRIEKMNTRLRQQFTVMDQIVTNLNTTSGYLNNLLSYTN